MYIVSIPATFWTWIERHAIKILLFSLHIFPMSSFVHILLLYLMNFSSHYHLSITVCLNSKAGVRFSGFCLFVVFKEYLKWVTCFTSCFKDWEDFPQESWASFVIMYLCIPHFLLLCLSFSLLPQPCLQGFPHPLTSAIAPASCTLFIVECILASLCQGDTLLCDVTVRSVPCATFHQYDHLSCC